MRPDNEITMKDHHNKGRGKAYAFLAKHVCHSGDECVKWPFTLNPVNGYGHLGYLGKAYLAHRLMCEMAHGPSPEGKPHAAHSCHTRSCVNPRHLAWKSLSENMLDRRENGTAHLTGNGRFGKLTQVQVRAIRALEGKMTQRAIAECFGITESTVRSVTNRETWADVA